MYGKVTQDQESVLNSQRQYLQVKYLLTTNVPDIYNRSNTRRMQNAQRQKED